MDIVAMWTGRHTQALRKAIRLTNEGFADRLGVSLRTVAKWSAEPDKEPGFEHQQLLDIVLEQAPGAAKARFGLLLEESAPHVSDQPSANIVQVPDANQDMMVMWMTALNGDEVPVNINRRSFVSGMAQLPAAGWLASGSSSLAAMVPAPVNSGDLNDLVQNMADLRTALATQDNILGPGTVIPTALHQVKVLQHLSGGATGASRASVMRLQSAYAEFTGWLADDLGERKAGTIWIDRALEWAHEGDDDLGIGYVLARKAQRASEEGNSAAAVALAKAAQRQGSLTVRVRAAAALYEAQGHAAPDVEDVVAFQKAIGRARELVDDGLATSPDGWAPWCTHSYVTMYEAAGWMTLGEPDRAATSYETGLANWPADMQRDAGLHWGSLANAYAAAGNPERAVEAANNALSIASRTGSARVVAHLRELPQALAEWSESAAVRTLMASLKPHFNAKELSE